MPIGIPTYRRIPAGMSLLKNGAVISMRLNQVFGILEIILVGTLRTGT